MQILFPGSFLVQVARQRVITATAAATLRCTAIANATPRLNQANCIEAALFIRH